MKVLSLQEFKKSMHKVLEEVAKGLPVELVRYRQGPGKVENGRFRITTVLKSGPIEMVKEAQLPEQKDPIDPDEEAHRKEMLRMYEEDLAKQEVPIDAKVPPVPSFTPVTPKALQASRLAALRQEVQKLEKREPVRDEESHAPAVSRKVLAEIAGLPPGSSEVISKLERPCSLCQSHTTNIVVTRSFKGKVTKKYVCPTCVEEAG